MKKKFTGANTPWGVSERPWTSAEATRLPPQSSVTASSTSAHDAHSALPRRGLTQWRTGGLDGALASGGRRLRMRRARARCLPRAVRVAGVSVRTVAEVWCIRKILDMSLSSLKF